jgi:hypothetical protein
MKLVVEILEDIFDVPSSTFYILVKFTPLFDKFYCPVGKGKQR